MNKFLPDNDRDLVQFIQQHRPLPPNPKPNLEMELMQLVEKEPRSFSRKISGILWVVPGTIAMGLVVTWNSQRMLEPTPQLVQDIQPLESFLVTNWETTPEDSYFFTTPEAEIEQLFSTVESPQAVSSYSFK